MNIKEALNILGVSGEYNPELIKLAYRKACKIYHPDRNPSGLEMMKLVNQAYDVLKNESGNHAESNNYGQAINEALSAIAHLDLEIEVCGSWVWLHGDTRPHREILKANKFKWAPKKKLWYYRPEDYKSFGRGKFSMDEIRQTHGSERVTPKERKRLYA